ncbi:hypothetical protein [Caenispirillum bisanense]|uniref:Uncharacterized protein n=1 Tax=Caenispirillum bisanense TaxID=414052 RepID=A0A286GH52_9PROT|nr:hypothetical protein [Caenispirillum bisanense]SOD94863.1 hypothetical protein SAMN05421508_104146 [Caenispirillum bisanense]
MRKTITLGQHRDEVEIIQQPAPNQPGRVLWADGMVTEITYDDLNALAYMAERARSKVPLAAAAAARASDGAAVEAALRSYGSI